ncbi:hypothetical protein ACIHDR_46890 [Nocardia sp. NPDC052278]|uniref:hypothetical protein n=1 Tax=unclassified Nocardia TaxID=2637762 RepID=UPI0036C88C56
MGGSGVISVGIFARQNSIWERVAPTLDEVSRWANENYRSLGNPVRGQSDPGRHSIISEVAFLMAKNDTLSAALDQAEIERQAREFVTRLPRSEMAHAALTEAEWDEAHKLSVEIIKYTHWKKGVEFSPSIPGCGIVDSAVADVLSGSELIEIKAVARPFRSKDFRQVLTYSAMLYGSGVTLGAVTLLNPRKSRVVTLNLNDLAVSGSGKSNVEVMQDLMMWMTGLQISA